LRYTSRMSATALILFAHGARDPEWANPLGRVRAAILEQQPQRRVELAFLEFMAPNLAAAVGELVRSGCDDIVVVPMFLAQGGHVKRDVPQMIAALEQEHPGLRLRLVTPVGEADGVVAAMAAYALASL